MDFYRHDQDGAHRVSGYAQPVFFEAELQGGVLNVPSEAYERLRELEAG